MLEFIYVRLYKHCHRLCYVQLNSILYRVSKPVVFFIMSSVLELNQKLFRFMGYMRPHMISWIPSLIPNILFAFFCLILMYGNIVYIRENNDNMSKATGAIYVLMALAICCASHIDVARKKRSIERFFTDFAVIVEEREWIYQSHQSDFSVRYINAQLQEEDKIQASGTMRQKNEVHSTPNGHLSAIVASVRRCCLGLRSSTQLTVFMWAIWIRVPGSVHIKSCKGR